MSWLKSLVASAQPREEAKTNVKTAQKRLLWLGHNAFLFQYDETLFLVDPFLPSNLSPEDVAANFVLVSHGHADHNAHAAKIARKNDAPIVAGVEAADGFAAQNLRVERMNVGGAIYVPISADPDVPKAQILAVAAPHSSGTPGGTPLGFVLSFSQNGRPLDPNAVETLKPLGETLADADAFSIYFACDCGFFGDMNWIGSLGIDVAVLPIGDRYAMGPGASLDAVRALQPKFVVPSHYDTWPEIEQNVERWSDAVFAYAAPSQPLVARIGVPLEADENGDWR